MDASISGPIIRSLLDTDFYKFTMAQSAWLDHRDVRVTYGFTNRTKKVRLAGRVSAAALRAELDHARTLRFAADETAYLRRLGMFREDFLSFLPDAVLPPYELSVEDGQFVFTTTGAWPEAIFWETLFLSIVNELYYRAELRERLGLVRQYEAYIMAMQEGERRMDAKIDRLADRPSVRFVEFGTRRRFSGVWQEHVARSLAWRLKPNLIGTSNVLLAKELGIKPVGTYAHELPMVLAALHRGDAKALRRSQMDVVEELLKLYEGKLPIYALIDTFGSESFLADMDDGIAARIDGFRIDSGDPVVEGERIIRRLEDLGIDPKAKALFFSDGLDVETIVGLAERFDGRARVAFGWGTNLTNDLGYAPLSLVVKAVAADGVPTVKLSNNPSKATGPDDEVALYKKVFAYREGQARECVY